MRDDFPKRTKDTLSKRVGLRCSNPTCRCLTMGPNSDPIKSTNVGVAAHICAASEGGPRYENMMTPEERRHVLNGIWLCQNCAKLIDSDKERYTVELMKEWKHDAEEEAFQLLSARSIGVHQFKRFENIFNLMPELIIEISQDIIANPLAREFVLLGRGWVYNSSKDKIILAYYYEDHDNLENKIQLLVNNCLVTDITCNNTKRYLFSEEFVQFFKV